MLAESKEKAQEIFLDDLFMVDIEEAEAEGRERMQKDGGILEVRIRRFFRKDGHIYYDGNKQWKLRRIN